MKDKEFNIVPISRYVWVKVEELKKEFQTSKGGIIMGTDMVEELQTSGIVLGVGILCDEKVKRLIKVGTRILFEAGTQKPKVVEGESYLLVMDTHVMAILPNE